MAIGFQPGFMVVVLGIKLRKRLPKISGVVAVAQMSDFMGDHVCRNASRGEEEPPVVREPAGSTAAPPFGFLITNRYSTKRYPELRGSMG